MEDGRQRVYNLFQPHFPLWRWSRNLSICPCEHQGTAPWCLDLLSTPVQRWWWLSTSPEHLPSISKPPVLPSPPHHLCGAEGNDPFGCLPRHFLSNALFVSLQAICCASACVSRSTYWVPSHLSVLLWYSFFKVACGENIAAPSNKETQPVTGTNYTPVVSEHSGERSERPCEWPLLTVHFTPLSNFVHLKNPRGSKRSSHWTAELGNSIFLMRRGQYVWIVMDLRTDPDCWSWLHGESLYPNLSLSPPQERDKPEF